MKPIVLALFAVFAPACATAGVRDPEPTPVDPVVTVDPSLGEVWLPTEAADWRAQLLFDNAGVGIWTVEPAQLFPELGAPEVIGLDDAGNAILCVGYSGKWSAKEVIAEGSWLGALEHGDHDPRIPGDELYVGGQRGNLYQVVPHGGGLVDLRLIASFPGRELHTLAAVPGAPELLAFTNTGELHRVTPTGAHGTFEAELVENCGGRVRDAVLLPGSEALFACVSRAGWLRLLSFEAGRPRWFEVHTEAIGLGRLALGVAGDGLVLYSTTDDGRVLRHAAPAGGALAGAWTTELVHVGSQGPRGIATGRFDPDPSVETVALFGYGKRVELLSREAGGDWSVHTLFEDVDKGHWLARTELDGRNATDELLLSGYGGRIVMLSRGIGDGLDVLGSTAP